MNRFPYLIPEGQTDERGQVLGPLHRHEKEARADLMVVLVLRARAVVRDRTEVRGANRRRRRGQGVRACVGGRRGGGRGVRGAL